MTDNWKDLPTFQDVAEAQAQGREIEVKFSFQNTWSPWDGKGWTIHWQFRARPRQPKMKKVKLLAFLGETVLQFVREDSIDLQIYAKNTRWIRQPHLDLEGEVPE